MKTIAHNKSGQV